jgi:succinoglycan biosynthesis protein ExoL
MDGKVEIVLRGRPALTEFDDFHGFVASQPHVSYEGTYRNPDDLAAIYSGVHLSWAIDYFEAGQNSKWLLPNRIYEGCLHGAVPVALQGTETAAFLRANGIGIVLPDTAPETLVEALGGLGVEALRGLAQAVAARPASSFAADVHDARLLVARLAEVAGVESGVALEVAA